MLVGSVFALVPALEIILVLKDRLPGAVAAATILALVAVVVILASTVISLVVNFAIPTLDGRGEGRDREDREREESSN